MSTELRVKLRGPAGAMDAQRVTQDLQQFVKMLRELEALRVGRRQGDVNGYSVWTFAHLKLGSVEAGLAPLEPRAGATWADLDAVSADVLDGFDQAERADVIPDMWAPEVAKSAQAIAGHLGASADTGMELMLVTNGNVVRTVEITRRASSNLRRALKVRQRSLGSVIGTLQSVSLHQRSRAGLWTDRGNRRVAIRFKPEQTDEIRNALGKRVMVKGFLERNASGQLLSAEFRRLEVLPALDEAGPLLNFEGFYPDVTDGLTIAEHLEDVRGAS